MNQTLQTVTKSNSINSMESLPKPHKQSIALCPKLASVKSSGSSSNQLSNLGDASRSVSANIHESSLVSPHHLDMNEDDDNKDDSCK